MSRITYAALRELEKTIVFSAVGISASRSDDSFNAASGLGGFLTDEWVFVSGFANASNNGWFQLKVDSTSAKITQVTPPVTHFRLPGVSGNFASTPDSVANSIIGDIDVRARIAAEDYTPSAGMTVIAKWQSSGNQKSYGLNILTDGTLQWAWSADGSAELNVSSTAIILTANGATVYVRATHDVDNGASGNDVKFYTSSDGSTWTQLGSTVTSVGVTSIFNGSAPLVVSGHNDGTTFPFNGRIYYAELRNLIDGPVVVAFEPERGSRIATSWAASSGETWTVSTSGSPPAQLQGRALITESPGSVVSIQGYRRGLGQSYDLEFYSERVDRSVSVKRNQHQPMGGGRPEVLLMRRETYFDVTVIGPLGEPLTEAQMPQWREFLASVEGGEIFTFDRYGTVAEPVEPKAVMLASEDYTEDRVAQMRRYRLSFRVRVL